MTKPIIFAATMIFLAIPSLARAALDRVVTSDSRTTVGENYNGKASLSASSVGLTQEGNILLAQRGGGRGQGRGHGAFRGGGGPRGHGSFRGGHGFRGHRFGGHRFSPRRHFGFGFYYPFYYGPYCSPYSKYYGYRYPNRYCYYPY